VAWNIVYAGTAPATGDPYPWFTDFDMELFPPHTAAGEWGPQRPILPPDAPTITSTGTASTATQLRDALYTGGVRVTMTADITGLNAVATDILDSEIVLPTGLKLISPSIGTFARLRIRGDTIGTYGGGQIHNLRLDGETWTDLIIDGINSSGSFDGSCMALGPAAGADKAAIVNSRLCAGGFAIGSTVSNLFVGGCSIISGMDTAAEDSPTNEEAYGIRCYHETLENVIVVHNEIRSNPARVVSSHARWRNHPDTGLDYLFGYGNRFVERVEHHIFNVDASAGGGTGAARATWFLYSEVISDGTGTDVGADTPKFFGGDQERVYVQNVAFKSSGFASNSDIALNGSTATTKSGNTYTSLPGSDPSWGAAIDIASGITPGCGDPSGIDFSP
jgi:hypothetical protein